MCTNPWLKPNFVHYFKIQILIQVAVISLFIFRLLTDRLFFYIEYISHQKIQPALMTLSITELRDT